MKKTEYAPETGGELYDVKAPPMLVDPFLPAGCLGGLSGGPGVGKTWFALEACRAVATGTPFLGQFAVQTTMPVLYVGSDSSRFDYGRCWRRLTKAQHAALGGEQPGDDPTDEYDPDAKIGDLNPLSDRVRFIVGSDFCLDDPDKVAAMIAAVDYEWGPYFYEGDEPGEINADGETEIIPGGWRREHGAGLVIMDTFGTLTDQDLIDNTAMIGVYKQLRRFVERTKATVLLLNHNPHNRETWLGAISQVGKLDFWLHLKRVNKNNDARLQVVFKKVRGIKPKAAIFYDMNVQDPEKASLVCETPASNGVATAAGVGSSADPLWQLVADEVKKGHQTVPNLVTAVMSIPDMAPSAEAARHKLRELLPKMIEKSAIAVVSEGRGKATVYGPAPDGVPSGGGLVK